MHFGNSTDMKGMSQDLSDCGLHNDKYTKYSPSENCGFRAYIESLKTHLNYCTFHLAILKFKNWIVNLGRK